MNIPQTIRRIRRRLRLSQQEAASRLMVVQSTWSKWEAGRCSPSKARLIAILAMEKKQ